MVFIQVGGKLKKLQLRFFILRPDKCVICKVLGKIYNLFANQNFYFLTYTMFRKRRLIVNNQFWVFNGNICLRSPKFKKRLNNILKSCILIITEFMFLRASTTRWTNWMKASCHTQHPQGLTVFSKTNRHSFITSPEILRRQMDFEGLWALVRSFSSRWEYPLLLLSRNFCTVRKGWP